MAVQGFEERPLDWLAPDGYTHEYHALATSFVEACSGHLQRANRIRRSNTAGLASPERDVVFWFLRVDRQKPKSYPYRIQVRYHMYVPLTLHRRSRC